MESCLNVTCPKTYVFLGQFGAETSLVPVNSNASENLERMDHNALEKNMIQEAFRGMA